MLSYKDMLKILDKVNNGKRFEIECNTKEQWNSICDLFICDTTRHKKHFKIGSSYVYFYFIKDKIYSYGHSNEQLPRDGLQYSYNTYKYHELFPSKIKPYKLKQY